MQNSADDDACPLPDDVVTPGCGDHLLMFDVEQARDLPDRGSVATELVSMNDVWDIIFSQESGQRSLLRLGISMPLKENVEHEAVLIYRAP